MAQTCVGSVSWRLLPAYATGQLEDVALSRLSTASEDRFSGFRGHPHRRSYLGRRRYPTAIRLFKRVG